MRRLHPQRTVRHFFVTDAEFRGFLCPGFPGHEWAMTPWTPRAYAVDDLGICTAETAVLP